MWSELFQTIHSTCGTSTINPWGDKVSSTTLLQWRHNEPNVVSITGVSILYLTVCSGADRDKRKLRVTTQRDSNVENVSIWWRLHVRSNLGQGHTSSLNVFTCPLRGSVLIWPICSTNATTEMTTCHATHNFEVKGQGHTGHSSFCNIHPMALCLFNLFSLYVARLQPIRWCVVHHFQTKMSKVNVTKVVLIEILALGG